jgi:hypothetical protein
MALNVWLVFIQGYDGRRLRRLEKWYILFAYGLPSIPAIAYLIHDHLRMEPHIYGPAIVGLAESFCSAFANWGRFGAGCARSSIGCGLCCIMRRCGDDDLFD